MKCAFCYALHQADVPIPRAGMDAFTIVNGHATCESHFGVARSNPERRFHEIIMSLLEKTPTGEHR